MDRSVLNLEENRQTYLTAFNFRLEAALFYHSKYPALSRSLLEKSLASGTGPIHKKPIRNRYELCNYCGQILTPGKYSCRLVPKKKEGKFIKKLQEIHKKCAWRLNKYKERLLKRENNCVTMVYKCLTCKRITKRVEVNKNLQKKSVINKRDIQAKVEVFTPTNAQTPNSTRLKVAPNSQSKKLACQTPLQPRIGIQLLASQKKSNKKKKRSAAQCQIKQILKFNEQNTSCKSRLESFLSAI